MPKHKPYFGGSPEDIAAINEHRKKGPPVGFSWRKEWPSSESSAELGREISIQLDLPPATPAAEDAVMIRACKSRGHSITDALAERDRVLKCRQ
jgi:hypothetical protein